MSTLPPPPPPANHDPQHSGQAGAPNEYGAPPWGAPGPTPQAAQYSAPRGGADASPSFGSGAPGQPGGDDTGIGGFFRALFDIRFTRFVTLKIVPVLYVISIVAISLTAVVVFFSSLVGAVGLFSYSYTAGAGALTLLVAIVGVPIGWLLAIVLVRVTYEFYIAAVQTARNTAELRSSHR